jgi:hypothetical protein
MGAVFCVPPTFASGAIGPAAAGGFWESSAIVTLIA